MNIGIVGGGPAGLYFALLMKKLDASHRITVVEQNPAGATYGWSAPDRTAAPVIGITFTTVRRMS